MAGGLGLELREPIRDNVYDTGSSFERQLAMDKMLRVSGAILALALPSAGGANALECTRVEGAIPPKEGVVSPLRPEAVPEAGRELKPGIPAGGRTAFHVTLPPELGTERAAQAPGTGPVPVAFHRDLPEE